VRPVRGHFRIGDLSGIEPKPPVLWLFTVEGVVPVEVLGASVTG
jgi:hypothetical protein